MGLKLFKRTLSFIKGLVNDAKTVIIIDHQNPLKNLFIHETRVAVGPCTLAQSDHLWGLAVTKPMILSTKGINMTWCRYIGLQHIQKSAF